MRVMWKLALFFIFRYALKHGCQSNCAPARKAVPPHAWIGRELRRACLLCYNTRKNRILLFFKYKK